MFYAELSDLALFGSMPRFGDMNQHAVIDLRRRFTRAELERAVSGAIEAFPVLGCRYETHFWRDTWRVVDRPVSDIVHVIDAPSDIEAETEAWARRSIDVTRERPLRIVSLGRGDGSRMIITFSHIAVDGGGSAAVGHVIAAKLYGKEPSLPTDPRRDPSSALDGLRWYHLPQLVRDSVSLPLHSVRTFFAAKRERSYAVPGGSRGSWRHIVISAEDTERIKSRCREVGASLNDALVAAIARAAGKRSHGGPVSVVYTMDLRRYQRTPRLTATNTSSIITAVVPRAALCDLPSAARAVAAITAEHKRGLIGPALLLAAITLSGNTPHELLRRVVVPSLHPGLVDLPISRGLLVTNVGRVDEGLAMFGDDVERIRIVGPILRGADVPLVVACGFRGEILLELFAPPETGPKAAEELENELREALEIGPGPASTSG